MQEREKRIRLKGQEYLIKKFTPEVGCHWAQRVIAQTICGISGGGKFSTSMIGKVLSSFIYMERPDSAQFHSDCLSFVYVVQPGGIFPLINEMGAYSVNGLTSPTIMALIVISAEYSFKDFLDLSLLSDLAAAIPGLSSMTDLGSGSKTSSSPLSDLDIGNTTTSETGNTQ